MPIVTLRDGSRIEIPEDLTPEEKAFLKANQAPSLLEDMGKAALAKLPEGIVRGATFSGDILNFGARVVNAVAPGTINKDFEKPTSDRAVEVLRDKGLLSDFEPETGLGRTTGAMASAAGAVLPLGGFKVPAAGLSLPGAISPTRIAAARVLGTPAVGAMAGAGAGQVVSEKAGPVAGFGTNIITQIAALLASRGLNPNSSRILRDAARELGPDDFKAAEGVRAGLEQAGAKTATLADVFPPGSRFRGIARDLSNTNGGEALANRLGGRLDPVTGEVPRLLDEATQALGPPASSVLVGQQVGERARGAVSAAKQVRSDKFLPILENAPPVPQDDLVSIIKALEARAGAPQNLGTVDQRSLEAAAKALTKVPLSPIPQPPTGAGALGEVAQGPKLGANLVALSKNIKDLKKGIPTDNLTLDQAAGFGAFKAADSALKEASPDFKRAMEVFAKSTVDDVNPVTLGLTGKLAKLVDNPTSETTLPALFKTAGKEEILATVNAVGGNAQQKAELARVLAERNQRALTTAGQAATDTQKLREVSASLVGPKAAATFNLKNKAADTLAKLSSEAGADTTLRQEMSQSVLSKGLLFFSEVARKSRLNVSAQETRVVAELFANPTAQNLKLLERISLERPELGLVISAFRQGLAAQASGGAIQEPNQQPASVQ